MKTYKALKSSSDKSFNILPFIYTAVIFSEVIFSEVIFSDIL